MIITAVAYAAVMQHSGCDCSKDQSVNEIQALVIMHLHAAVTQMADLHAIHIDNCITIVYFLLCIFSAQCRSVCILSKAVIIAEHTKAVPDWAKDIRVLRNLSRLDWAREERIHETPFRAGFAKREVNSLEFDEHIKSECSVSFPHTFTFTREMMLVWSVCVVPWASPSVCCLVCDGAAPHTWLTNADSKAW